MLTISPVLAGTFEAPEFAANAGNINISPEESTSSLDTTGSIDDRRYTKFDRTAADAGSANISFSDILDAINPLQHIPVVSSLYRAVTGDTINPVARITGDIAYGVIGGPASAVLGGLGAVADSVFQSQNGESAIAVAMNTLFGESSDTKPAASPTQLASATPSTASPLTSSAPPATTAVNSATSQGTGISLAKAFASPNTKQPYGGVMDVGSLMQAQTQAIQAQNQAIGLAESSHGIRIGSTIYTTALMMSGRTPVSPQTTPSAPIATQLPTQLLVPPVQTAQTIQSAPAKVSNVPATNALPQSLMDDIMALKAINQYKSTADAAASQQAPTVNIQN